MNMRGFIGGLIIFLFSCFMHLSPVSAASPGSLWPSDGVYTVNQTAPINPVANNLCNEQTIKTVYYFHLPRSERETCVYETEYGSYASSGHLKRYVGDYVQLAPAVIPVPNTNKMYAKVCTSSCRLVYYDTSEGFSGSNTSGGYKLTPKALSTQVRNPANNLSLNVFSIGFSPNGKWLAIETTGGFVRHDTKTGEFLKFSNPRGAYGVGQNPSFKYSITDDGRYIALSGVNYRNATVFDLATCTNISSPDPVGTLAACESVELTEVAKSKGFHVSTLYGATFRAGAREITAYGPGSDNKTEGYVFRLDSLEARADYVALGDSFSSGEGDVRDNTRYLSGTDGSSEFPNEKCHVSNRSYPYLLNKHIVSTDSFFKSVACSGAVTKDISGNSSTGRNTYIGQFRQGEFMSDIGYKSITDVAIGSDIPGRVPQYKFIEKYQPKNISITIGGNDAGFGEVLASCVTAGGCEFESTERAAKALEMHSKYEVLRKTYRKIIDASPNTNLFVLSYPQFIDDSDQCNPNVGMNKAERTFVQASVSYFNQVVRQAALAEGAMYIDIESSLQGEALCSAKLLDLAVNGIVSGDDKYAVIGSESFHPNSRGHELIANHIKNTYGAFPDLKGETCPLESCGSYRAPAIPTYFSVLPSTVQRYKVVLLEQANSVVKRGSQVGLRLKNYVSNAVGLVSIHSTPQSLGSVIADDTGEFNASVTLPSDLEPGYHELHIETNALDGTKISYYQPLTIINSDQDIDGDGPLNDVDACQFVEASGEDKDADGVDDACDGDIYSAPVAAALPDVSQTSAASLLLAANRLLSSVNLYSTGQIRSEVAANQQELNTERVAGVRDVEEQRATTVSDASVESQNNEPTTFVKGILVVVSLTVTTLGIRALRKYM